MIHAQRGFHGFTRSSSQSRLKRGRKPPHGPIVGRQLGDDVGDEGRDEQRELSTIAAPAVGPSAARARVVGIGHDAGRRFPRDEDTPTLPAFGSHVCGCYKNRSGFVAQIPWSSLDSSFVLQVEHSNNRYDRLAWPGVGRQDCDETIGSPAGHWQGRAWVRSRRRRGALLGDDARRRPRDQRRHGTRVQPIAGQHGMDVSVSLVIC